jgi:hypothetical protein
MLTVHNGELMVEEKGIYSIEKFLVARRLMYWQVYLHKTVLSAEQMLQRIIRRARETGAACLEPLHAFIQNQKETLTLEQFCSLDDYDVFMAIKQWMHHPDPVLSYLCRGIIDRKLLKVKYFAEPLNPRMLADKQQETMHKLGLSAEETGWLVFTGEASSSMYNFENEHIHILFKDGTVRDISEVDNALINENMKGKIKKYYICYPG